MDTHLNLTILLIIAVSLFVAAIMITLEISLKVGILRPFNEVKGFGDKESVIKRRKEFLFILLICWGTSCFLVGYYLYETRTKEIFLQYSKYTIFGTALLLSSLYGLARPWTKDGNEYDEEDDEIRYIGKDIN